MNGAETSELFPVSLSEQDARSVDRLMERGFNGAEDEREAKVLELLRTLDEDPRFEHRDARVDAVFLAVRRRAARDAAEPELHPLDQEALDALVLAGHRLDRVPKSLRQRAQAAVAIGRLLTDTPPAVEFSKDLPERTLERIQEEVDTEAESLRFERPRPARSVPRWADLASLAALLVLGASVLWPVLQAGQHHMRRASSMAQLGGVAGAFGRYAEDYDGGMPLASAAFDGSWMEVGAPRRSNSANLYTLVHGGYSPIASLASPGNPHAPTEVTDPDARDWRTFDEVSYSYQLLPAPLRPLWAGGRQAGRSVVLADRSPVILRILRGERARADENSPNFNGAGQHVLFEDGSVRFLETPELENGDNIWLPRRIEEVIQHLRERIGLEGSSNELPETAEDAFVGP